MRIATRIAIGYLILVVLLAGVNLPPKTGPS